MDLISTNTIEFTALALNGLSARHKAISSNIANADTPGYKRVDVSFEDQLSKIINTESSKEAARIANSVMQPVAGKTELPLTVNNNSSMMENYNFQPMLTESDINQPDAKGNSVDLEQEMSKLAKNGMTYDALALIQSKEFKMLGEVLKGT